MKQIQARRMALHSKSLRHRLGELDFPRKTQGVNDGQQNAAERKRILQGFGVNGTHDIQEWMAEEHQDGNAQSTTIEHEEIAGTQSDSNTSQVAEPTPSDDVEPQRASTEVIDVEPEPVRPLPPSLRVKSALDATSPPMNVMSTLPSASWPPTIVADVMTRKIITIREDEPVENLEECMQRFKFRHLPVVDGHMNLVGLISRTDLLHAELGRKPDGTPAPRFDGQVQAGSIMRRNVVVARPDYPLPTACRVMLEKKLTCLPVVLEDGKLAGMLTDTDFVKLSLLLLESRAKSL